MNVLIVGASRGIGFEFAKQYAAAGTRVLATCRAAHDADKLHAEGCDPVLLDLRDGDSIEAFARTLDAPQLDVVVLSAGVYGPRTVALQAPTQEDFDAVMQTNVWGPMQLITRLAPRLVAARGKLAVLSSRMGSTSLMGSTYGWLYRASKAALNNVVKCASLELGPQGVACLAFHPGWVRTDMGGAGADLDITSSVASMRRVIAQ
ncbi:MAG TPA: SDR family oxidoreductase, partial [Burkholderiaceae bacterium]|nr:SDR family oxidoreductase [Burkholderiaceae bacterium]